MQFWDGEPVFLYGKKMMGSTTSNYYITADPAIENLSHPSFIGKVQSNFSGSLYQVFDNGVNPGKASPSIGPAPSWPPSNSKASC